MALDCSVAWAIGPVCQYNLSFYTPSAAQNTILN